MITIGNWGQVVKTIEIVDANDYVNWYYFSYLNLTFNSTYLYTLYLFKEELF